MQRKTERPFWTVRLPPSVEELPRLKDEKLGRQLYACIKLDTASDAGVLHLGELLDRNAEEQDGNGKRYIDVPFGEDAKTFMKAQTEWSRSQMQRLNCEIDGTQNIWGYEFYVNGKRYGVHFTTNDSFTTNKKIRTCIIVDGSGTPLFKKVTDDVSKVSQDDAALVLKTFLLSKIKEDEKCQSR